MGRKHRQGKESSIDAVEAYIYGLFERYKDTHSQEEIDRLVELEPRLRESIDTLRKFTGLLDIPLSQLDTQEEEKNQLTYLNAAEAMFSDYEVIYYINLDTEDYVEYSAPNDYATLKLENSGSQFFRDLAQNIKRVVYEKDQERVTNALSREALLPKLEDSRVFSVTYRLMIKGQPVYYCSKAIRPRQGNYMIIGICRVDSQSQYELHFHNSQKDNINFSNVARALSSDFDRIYYVNMENDSYVRYATREKGRMIKIASSGSSFFKAVERISHQVIYSRDEKTIREIFTKEYLLNELRKKDMISLTYRILVDGIPFYHNLKVLCPSEGDFGHILVCVRDIDEQMREEVKYVEEKHLNYAKIAETLSRDYFSIYLVEIDSGHYLEYSTNGYLQQLEIINRGDDFFGECQKNVGHMVYIEDQEMVRLAYQRDHMLAELDKTGSFLLVYRYMLNGKPIYVNAKATRIEGDEGRIIIGLSNVDAQVRQQKELERALQDKLTFSQIAQCLSKDYFSVYYVDITDDAFIEYISGDEYRELKVEREGMKFFYELRQDIRHRVHEEDRDRLLNVFTKETILQELETGHPFKISYRIMMGKEPVYVNMKADYLDETKCHILVGISNINAQMTREKEYAKALRMTREMVEKDALTGAKSKHAYKKMEEKLNKRIMAKIPVEFAVVVCDVNNLKLINDTKGHKEGDRYIKEACQIIFSIFGHGNVFRIGGDEFAVILQGKDYEDRGEFLSLMRTVAAANQKTGKVVIASGLSDYDDAQDLSFESVFQRADDEMYHNKAALKKDGLSDIKKI